MNHRSRPLLIIVSRHELLVYAHLFQVFADSEHVEVVLDRRLDGRRSPDGQSGSAHDRRQHDISSSLNTLGWAIVRRSTPASRGRAA
ncbi:MAG: hypothetical protein AUH29_05675 [Candidatus Rokubacteria bacterium 13_1_40CM_69_27]|nr:MAG: hypothetical protein AUH29_05675 [Candidatus Rokubacteria bacterium 13_1_40CM_69_27]OLC32483.1 MAG: hypothetical protein AUH81_16220 [Candidatus Rokubacteria bacterium 13_1_40CM_4_69_5]OLE38166.1 MAG: hypothetical protein AUG00_06130 [Candidatus Rokubacteria bacterium 13_1_20CM_2_70_7]